MNLLKLKYFVVILTLFVGSVYAFGQRKGVNNLTFFDDRQLHFGFYLGLNTMDYRITNYNNVLENPVFASNTDDFKKKALEYYGNNKEFAAEVYTILPGFTVGGVVNYRLNRDFDLRFTPGMSLGSRSFKYFIPLNEALVEENGMDKQTYLTTPSAYVDLPIGIRYKGFRHFNTRPYVYLGVTYRQDLENKRITESVVHLKKSGEYAEIGLGIDSYLEYFRFTAEFRFSYGLNSLIRHDTDPQRPIPFYGFIFKELDSNIFTLIFYFE
ncbi:MAG: outer membrane beta-barrel protein [Bacteroidia bacterium]|nr:outer membrane beta-barrel protein [Bacteroidia bacterium]